MQLKIDQQQQPFVQCSKEIDAINSKQSFSIIYDNSLFIVDPISLCNASLRFNEIINPYIHDNEFMQTHHLEIHCNDFTKRNINNFLNICQDLPNDVQDSEMKEICEIAKMFKANDIYKIGLSFVNNSIDPNFTIPDFKYDSNEHIMTIVNDKICIQDGFKMNNVYFQDVFSNSTQDNFYNAKINGNNESNLMLINGQDAKNNGLNEIKKQIQKQVLDKKKKKHSVIYKLHIEKKAFKSPCYKCFFDNQMIYYATQKRNKIYIKNINSINNTKNKNHIGYIIQNEAKRSNSIQAGDITFNLNYISTTNPKYFTIDVSFPAYNKIVSWFPKPLKYDLRNDNYYRNFHGEHHRRAIMSSKNIVLQNDAGHLTFIVRKMDKNMFEFECNRNVDPLIAFTIGLSGVVGPYKDPWSTVNGTMY